MEWKKKNVILFRKSQNTVMSWLYVVLVLLRPMMVITQKITSLAFEIHDGKASVCFLCVCACASVVERKVTDVTEVKMPVQFSHEFKNGSHGQHFQASSQF